MLAADRHSDTNKRSHPEFTLPGGRRRSGRAPPGGAPNELVDRGGARRPARRGSGSCVADGLRSVGVASEASDGGRERLQIVKAQLHPIAAAAARHDLDRRGPEQRRQALGQPFKSCHV